MTIGIEAAHANKKNKTGVEQYCFQIIQHLKKIIPADVRVILYVNEPLKNGLEILPPNWQEKILFWPFGKLWSQFRLSWEFFRRPPDVFFAPGQLIPFFTPRNTVTTVHDSAFLVYPGAYNFFGRQYLKWMNRRILNKSGIILTPSQFTKNELRRLYNFNTAGVRVTSLGYDRNAYYSGRTDDAVIKKYGITKEFILFVGRLEEKKNTANIVRAFNLVKKQFDCQLVLAGQPGVGYEEVEKAVNDSPYKTDIIRPGWVADADIPVLMNSAKVFVFPSLYEGFGLPVLESMACGCPVVASTGNSLEEVGGDAVLYVDSANSSDIAGRVFEIIGNPEKRAGHKQKGLLRAALFSWEKCASAVWQALREAEK